MRTITYDDEKEDVIIVHLGRVLSEELYNQIAGSIVKVLDMKYPANKEWRIES